MRARSSGKSGECAKGKEHQEFAVAIDTQALSVRKRLAGILSSGYMTTH